MLKIPWTARRTNKPVFEEISPPCTLEALMLKQKLPYFGHIMRAENESLEKSTVLGMFEGREEEAELAYAWGVFHYQSA